MWLTEHHFDDDGYTPSPLVIAAAIGERTKRMRIGTKLMLLPLADPVRLAEDAAGLAILTDGRFDLGVGLGSPEQCPSSPTRPAASQGPLSAVGRRAGRRGPHRDAAGIPGDRGRALLGPVPG